MTENKKFTWDPIKMAEPTEFMNYEQLIERLKKDLGIKDKIFWVFDMQVPHDEAEYQESLRVVRMIRGMATKAVDKRKDDSID